MTTLAELPFTDLLFFGTEEPEVAVYTTKGELLTDLSPETRADALTMYAAMRQLEDDRRIDDSILFYGGRRYRLTVLPDIHGRCIAARKVVDTAPTLATLVTEPALRRLDDIGKRGGLVVITGAADQGKTTLQYSLLQRWLEQHGGIATCIGDPCEIALPRHVGRNGLVIQSDMPRDQFQPGCERALRSNSRYHLISEIRNSRTAAAVVQASATGHTVITCLHGENVLGAMHQIAGMVQNVDGSFGLTRLAQALQGVICVQLRRPAMTLNCEYFFLESGYAASARGLIREAKIGQLSSTLDHQRREYGGR